jgi:uncharacterized protein DUF4160
MAPVGVRLIQEQRTSVRMIGRMSPTIHDEDGFRFWFWSVDRTEPPHVHVGKGGARGKWWLNPIRERENGGFNPSQQRRIRNILVEQHDRMLERWNETFK